MRKLLLMAVMIVTVITTGACAVKKIDTSHTTGSTKNIPVKAVTSWDRILEENKIVIGTDGSTFNKNLAESLKKEMGVDVEIISYSDFEKAGEAVKNGEIDMYLGMFPKETALSIDYYLSEPYLQSTSVVVSLSQDYKINKKEDTVAVLKNSAEEKTVSMYCDNYKAYNSVGAMFLALNSSQASSVLIDEIVFEKSGYNTNKYFVCDSYPYNLVAIFNENESDIAKEMNIYLAKIKASGTASEISRENFGKDIIYK